MEGFLLVTHTDERERDYNQTALLNNVCDTG